MARSEAMQKFAQTAENFPEVNMVVEGTEAVMVKSDRLPAKLFRLAEQYGLDNESLINYQTGNKVLSFK